MIILKKLSKFPVQYPLESSVLELFSFSALYSELLENLNEGKSKIGFSKEVYMKIVPNLI